MSAPADMPAAPMVELVDVEQRLALFAEGIGGRYYHIKASREFSGRRIQLGANQAALTSDTLYLPERLGAPDSAAYRVLVLQQIGHREFDTYGFRMDAAQTRVPGLSARTAVDLGLPMSDFEAFYHRFAYPALASRLLHLCERARVDALLLERYPGMRRHMAAWRAHQLARQPQDAIRGLGGVLHALDCRLLDAPADALLARDTTGCLEQALHRLQPSWETPGDVYQSAEGCCRLYDLLEPLQRGIGGDAPLLLDDEFSEPANWVQREARLDDWRKDLEQLDSLALSVEMLEGDEAVAADADHLRDGEIRPDDLTLKQMKDERDDLARRIGMERSAIRDALGKSNPNARSFRYDEWSYLERRYLPRWCRLFEERLAPDHSQDLAALQAVIRGHRHGVQKPLEQIRPLGYQRVHRVADGDELDFNAVMQARQDSRAGQTPDDRVYSRRERVHRDVCAAFLVDLSASTDDPTEPPEPGPDWDDEDAIPNLRDPFSGPTAAPETVDHSLQPPAPPRRIIDVQRDAMLVMSAALDQLGDSYGIYGFSGYGRDCVEFFVAKEPDEAFTRNTLAAIAGMKPKRSTRMGPAIRHATKKLIASGNALKVLLVLSDGFPQDADYGPERGEHEYGVQDTGRALREAHDKGVETFCVTVDRSGHDYLKRMCPDARYLVIEEIEDLPEALSKVYQALTS